MNAKFEDKAQEIHERAVVTLGRNTIVSKDGDWWINQLRLAFADELRRARSMGELDEEEG